MSDVVGRMAVRLATTPPEEQGTPCLSCGATALACQHGFLTTVSERRCCVTCDERGAARSHVERRKAARGEAREYLLAVLTTMPTECTAWPFATRSFGSYGQVRIDGKQRQVHRVVAEWYLGPCPVGLEVRHTCGNGRTLGCFTPAHLRYGTRKENIADRSRHRAERDQRAAK